MKKTIKKLLLMFAYGFMLIFGAMFAVWASWKTIEFTSGDGKLTAQSGEKLTLAKRNEMVSRVRGIFTDSNGNVGIGTSSPNQKLEVNGNIGANNYCNQDGTNCIDPEHFGNMRFEGYNAHFLGIDKNITVNTNWSGIYHDLGNPIEINLPKGGKLLLKGVLSFNSETVSGYSIKITINGIDGDIQTYIPWRQTMIGGESKTVKVNFPLTLGTNTILSPGKHTIQLKMYQLGIGNTSFNNGGMGDGFKNVSIYTFK